MSFKTLHDYDLTGKTVLLRADLNVPVQNGAVSDTTRIDRLKPTIDLLKEKGARTLILSHYGRPKGEPNKEFTLEFLTPALEKSWGVPVKFAHDCVGEEAQTLANTLKNGEFARTKSPRVNDGFLRPPPQSRFLPHDKSSPSPPGLVSSLHLQWESPWLSGYGI